MSLQAYFLRHRFRTSDLVVLLLTASPSEALHSSDAVKSGSLKTNNRKNKPTTFADENSENKLKNKTPDKLILPKIEFVNLSQVGFHSSISADAGGHGFILNISLISIG